MIDYGLRTKSYGYIQARDINAAVARLSPEARERVLCRIDDRLASTVNSGESHDPKALSFVRDSLSGRKPRVHLGHWSRKQ